MVRFTDVAIIRNVRIPKKSIDKDCRSRRGRKLNCVSEGNK